MTRARNANPGAGLLNFPNPSRSYDETEHGVHFWGYDQTIEVSFFVEESALSRISPQTRQDEAGFLTTFDVHRDRIRAVADKVYSRRRKGAYIFSYTLTEADF